MNVLIALVFAAFVTSGYGLAGGIGDRGFSTHSQTDAAPRPASRDAAGPNRVLLDSLGACPGTRLIREYVLRNGDLRRQYASPRPLDQAPTAVTVFYRDKLLAQGWHPIEEHAAVSAYAKGDQVFAMERAGPDDPGLPTGARLLESAAPPVDAKFFFSIEAGAKR
jgi:hypothetical protein